MAVPVKKHCVPAETSRFGSVSGRSAHAAVSVGQKAPDFIATDVTGKQHRLSDFAGKYVVLEWTNPGCPFVRKHYGSGNMQSTQKAAADKGVVW